MSKVSLKNSISTQLLKVIFGLFLLITITVTVVQMLNEYDYTAELVQQQIEELKETFGPGIANALWTFNDVQLQSILEGMNNISIVEGIEINDGSDIKGFGLVIRHDGEYGRFNSEGVIQPLDDNKSPLKVTGYKFPIEYKEQSGEVKELGFATIYTSSTIIFSQVKHGFIMIIVGAIIKTIALWIIFLFFVRKLLGEPLLALTRQTQSISLDQIDDVKIDIPVKEKNELAVLQDAFNHMISNLRFSKKSLDELNRSLESQVDERTRDLSFEVEQRKQAQQIAEQALAAKSMFLANMSHEIRTPLTAVIGMTKILDGTTQLDEQQKEHVAIILRNSKNLMDIINDILDFSKFEAGAISLEYSEFSLADLIKDIISDFQSQIEKKVLHIETDISDDVNGIVYSDITRLSQILRNLISNAIKFTDQGTITISVNNEQADREDSILFSVTDTGVGIPANAQKNIFETFTQADASTSRKYGGTGLGLAICKAFTEMLGGHIWLESEELKGTTFYFTIDTAPAKRKRELEERVV